MLKLFSVVLMEMLEEVNLCNVYHTNLKVP